MKRTASIVVATLLVAATTFAQRNIVRFSEQTITKGQTVAIDGQERSKPDIYYIDNGDNTYEAVRLTVKPASQLQDVTEPYLMASTPTSVVVAWKTSSAATGSTVTYGTSASNLDQTATIGSTMIARTYYWNTATLSGLQPDTEYFYNVSTNGKESGVKQFRTQPSTAAGTVTRVLLIGDHQRNDHSDYEWLVNAAKRKADQLYGEKPIEAHFNFIMNVGDQVDFGASAQYEQVMLHKASVVSANLPHMTTVGNHEYKSGPYTTDQSKISFYRSHFKNTYGAIEYQGITSDCAEYYAYQSGRVLFVVLDSDVTSDAQKMWVNRVAEAATTDTTVDFIVAVQHRPLYAEMYCYDVSPWARDEIMPILARTGKLVLDYAGHHHLYARGQMTDYPFYHIISGGGVGTDQEGYEQLWGVTFNDLLNQSEVQKTIDMWTYQIATFDSSSKTMTVETYSIGNRRIALDNVLVDRFSINLNAAKPAKPALSAVASPVTAPYTFTQASAIGDDINTVQYQISKSQSFSTIEVNSLVNREDMYGVDDNLMPLDLNAGRDISAYKLDANALGEGSYYIRVRNRNNDLRWSDYSNPVEFTVTTPDGSPYLSIDKRYMTKGSTITVTYHNAPVGTDAWVAIYEEGKNGSDGSKEWAYTSGADGSVSWRVNDKNKYYAVMFRDGGYSECSPRYHFVVGERCDDSNPPTVALDKEVYGVGEPVKVECSNVTAIGAEWVGMYGYYDDMVVNGDVTYAKSYSYVYLNGSDNQQLTLNVSGAPNFNVHHNGPAEAGYYFVGWFINDGYVPVIPYTYFAIGHPATLSLDKPTYGYLYEDMEVSYSRIPAELSPRLVISSGGVEIYSQALDGEAGSVTIPVNYEWKFDSERYNVLATDPITDCLATITNGNGEAISDPVMFELSYPTGIESVKKETVSVSVAAHTLIINSTDGISTVDVYSVAGQCVAAFDADGVTSAGFNLDLTPGIYIVAVNGVTAGKIALK